VAHGRVFVDRGIGDRSGGSPDAVTATATRRLAAILAADVAGYSRLMGADEEGTLNRLKAHRRQLVDPKISEHHGRIVKTTGDGMLVEFSSVVDAVRCAAEIQRAMVDRGAEISVDKRITFRIGINLGDVIIDGDDIYGDGVNIAARLEALAEPGGICVSRTVRDHIGDRLPYAFDDMGEQSVKNIAQPVHAYAMNAAAVASLPEVTTPAQSRSPRRRSASRLTAVAASIVGAIGLGTAVWWAWPIGNSRVVPVQAPVTASVPSPSAPAAKPVPRLSIVVLPFANLSNDPDQEYFVDGITDDLTTDLSRISGSFVIARNTAFTYKGKPVDAKQIGRELGVRYVLEGSVRRAGDKVQVNVQLIDATTGAHLWADRFDTERANLAAAQTQITGRLARTLGVELIRAEERRIEADTGSPDARDLVMRGWAWSYKPTSAATLQQSQRFFEQALEIDPLSIDARIGIARTLLAKVSNESHRSAPQDVARAEQLLLETLEHDPDRSAAHEAMGLLRRIQGGRLSESRMEHETALALDPNNLLAVRQLGWTLLHLGEPDAAIAQGEKALRLSPRDPGIWSLYGLIGWCHMVSNRVDEAIDFLIKSRATNPRVWWVHYGLAGALGLKGNLEEGKTALAESLKLKPEINSLAQYYAIRPWQSSPQYYALEDKTTIEGLRRIGFPEK
jgi:TolB-like protein/class 3 adenylate cyclase/tetratricopeptide (TPR) repeat protein